MQIVYILWKKVTIHFSSAECSRFKWDKADTGISCIYYRCEHFRSMFQPCWDESGKEWVLSKICCQVLTLSMLGKNFGRHFEIFFVFFLENRLGHSMYFSWKTDLDIPCKLSPKETICMKCQSFFSDQKIRKISSNIHCLNLSIEWLNLSCIDTRRNKKNIYQGPVVQS